MTSLTKNTTNSSSADTSSLGRLLFIAATTVLAMAAASLWAFVDSYEVTLKIEGGEACGVRRAVSLPTRVVVRHCPPRVNVIGSPVPAAADLHVLSATHRAPNPCAVPGGLLLVEV